MVRGRPREFDPDDTLDQVLTRFWRDGFDGASMQDLADAVGVSKPSLYAAFGNKEALFLAALQRYATSHAARQAAELEREPDARVAVRRMLEDAAGTPAPRDGGQPAGCMLVNSSSLCASTHVPDAVQSAVSSTLRQSSDALACRLERAAREGALPPTANPQALAAYFSAVLCGLSVHARGGADRAALEAVVETAMQAWPTSATAAQRSGHQSEPS